LKFVLISYFLYPQGDNARGAGAKCPVYVLRVELHQRTNLMHYQPNGDRPFLKIVTLLPGHIPTCRTVRGKRLCRREQG
jgi:hypothetical protein